MLPTSENVRQTPVGRESALAKVFGKLQFAEQSKRARLWLALFAVIGVVLILLYHDAEQQDSAYHFLFARWAWQHPAYFVSVWARPLFTLVYFPPSQLGYPAAKLFTVILSLLTAWQTFRLAQQINFRRAELAVPLLFLQPAFFALSSVVMTETLFAMLFVVALRLHLSGWKTAGMLVASSLILVRPEGVFIGVLWGLWGLQLADGEWRIRLGNDEAGAWFQRAWQAISIRNPQSAIRILLLASGLFIWWLAAYRLTGDGLWIVHNWPSDWQAGGRANGAGPIWWYVVQLPLIAGAPLFALFLFGLWKLIRRREFICGTSAFLTLFLVHSIMFTRGWFGSAGYARYFVCVSPVIALITLAGWNELAESSNRFFDLSKRSALTAVLVVSAAVCFIYVDSTRFTRDARAVEEMSQWLRVNHPQLINNTSELAVKPSAGQLSRLICSQAYTRVLFDRDPWEKPSFSADHNDNIELLRQSPTGTLALWDEETGPKWYRLRAEDFENAGYRRLKSQDFKLEGWIVRLKWKRFGGARLQRMHWFYKSSNNLMEKLPAVSHQSSEQAALNAH